MSHHCCAARSARWFCALLVAIGVGTALTSVPIAAQTDSLSDSETDAGSGFEIAAIAGRRLGYERDGADLNGATLVGLELTRTVWRSLFVIGSVSHRQGTDGSRRTPETQLPVFDRSATLFQAGLGLVVGNAVRVGAYGGPGFALQEVRDATSVSNDGSEEGPVIRQEREFDAGAFVGAFVEAPAFLEGLAVRVSIEDFMRFNGGDTATVGSAVSEPEHDRSIRAALRYRPEGGAARSLQQDRLALSLYGVRRVGFESTGATFAGTNSIGGEASFEFGSGIFLLAGARNRPAVVSDGCVLDTPPPCFVDGQFVLASAGLGYMRPWRGVRFGAHASLAAELATFGGEMGLMAGALADVATPLEGVAIRIGVDDYMASFLQNGGDANNHDWFLRAGLAYRP
jgi:hypothetical protein